MVPNLLHWQGSVICIDIKGENYAIASGYRAGTLNQDVFRFDPFEEEGQTHRFNPLAYISAGERRINDIQTLAGNLIPGQGRDPCWDDAARDLFIGLALLVVEAGPHLEWPVSIGQVNRLVRTAQETAEHLQDLLKDLEGQGIAICETCRRYILSWCNEPVEPRGSIKSTPATKLTLWSSPLVDRATEDNDFDLRDFRRQPISLYISIAPDDLKKLAPLIRVLIETFLSLNTRAGETPEARPELQVPVLLMLDQFLSLGPKVKLVDALAYVRGRGIKVATVIQSEAQLQALYGREQAALLPGQAVRTARPGVIAAAADVAGGGATPECNPYLKKFFDTDPKDREGYLNKCPASGVSRGAINELAAYGQNCESEKLAATLNRQLRSA